MDSCLSASWHHAVAACQPAACGPGMRLLGAQQLPLARGWVNSPGQMQRVDLGLAGSWCAARSSRQTPQQAGVGQQLICSTQWSLQRVSELVWEVGAGMTCVGWQRVCLQYAYWPLRKHAAGWEAQAYCAIGGPVNLSPLHCALCPTACGLLLAGGRSPAVGTLLQRPPYGGRLLRSCCKSTAAPAPQLHTLAS